MSSAGIVAAVTAVLTPMLPIALGLVAIALGAAIMRSLGPSHRVGRLLAITPTIPIAEARALAAGGARYVAIRGRIDADDEFEDDAHRPLVLRRVRIQLASGTRWTTIDEQRQAIDFELTEGLDAIGIDHAALGAGLVVIPRESVGTAADAPERMPAGTAPTTPMRLRIEQLSSVEHAIVVGVPTQDPVDGTVRMTTGLGRPLILTTLEKPEAMRMLAADGPRRPLAAAIAVAVGLLGLTFGLAWALVGALTATVLAASPEPTTAPGGDPRSSGQGPGLVGEPLIAIGLVVAIGVAAAILTTLYLRLTEDRRS